MPTKKITQKSLSRLIQRRKHLEDIKAEIKTAEESLLASLKGGAAVESGLLTARLNNWERRNVAWKQVLIREKGEEFCERVFNATRPDKYETLVAEIAG